MQLLLADMSEVCLETALGLLDLEIHLQEEEGAGAVRRSSSGGSSPSGMKKVASAFKLGPSWLAVKSYVIRCLRACDPERVSFFLPQLVQALRSESEPDSDRSLEEFLMSAARSSVWFAQRLVWALETEAKPPAEAFNPEIKRSGWEPPRDTGLWSACGALKQRLMSELPTDELRYIKSELEWLESITDISGRMKKVPAEGRKDEIAKVLRGVNDKFADHTAPGVKEYLYLPTAPHRPMVRAVPESGAVMQSAAKFPVLVAFEVAEPHTGSQTVSELTMGPVNEDEGTDSPRTGAEASTSAAAVVVAARPPLPEGRTRLDILGSPHKAVAVSARLAAEKVCWLPLQGVRGQRAPGGLMLPSHPLLLFRRWRRRAPATKRGTSCSARWPCPASARRSARPLPSSRSSTLRCSRLMRTSSGCRSSCPGST